MNMNKQDCLQCSRRQLFPQCAAFLAGVQEVSAVEMTLTHSLAQQPRQGRCKGQGSRCTAQSNSPACSSS